MAGYKTFKYPAYAAEEDNPYQNWLITDWVNLYDCNSLYHMCSVILEEGWKTIRIPIRAKSGFMWHEYVELLYLRQQW